MLYFGVEDKNHKGHYLFDNTFYRGPNKYELNLLSDHLVYFAKIDGSFCPENTKEAGVANLTQTNEFTILSFWDYSGDSRPGSNSNFIEFGKLSYELMLEIARKTFPTIFERFDFEIVLLEEK